ncbi:electrogenic sodium bicarbonate cotransporter 1-like isoform X2 [Sycon ciliatum]|uniref:electrogenic sodium bicarbonate cotransporter 1-like isoform X2 n=1 Tax=Sycon ciliatum TaxID=27933 RepID=UPI0020AED637|eukprot:scpid17395/ scgid4404/ Sodium-driven chloride bicarbonate exchanger; Solute carrier family 4 member 10
MDGQRYATLEEEPAPAYDAPGVGEDVAPNEKVRWIVQESELGQAGADGDQDLLTEMQELRRNPHGQPEWKETGRWVKYEESIEWGGDKWSKPHVASLSLHSLFEVRSCLLSSAVELDLDATGLEEVADKVVGSLVQKGDLTAERADEVKQIFLSKHSHQYQIAHPEGKQTVGRPACLRPNLSPVHGGEGVRQRGEKAEMSHDPRFLRKLSKKTEVANVLIGDADFLERPIMVFARLRTAQIFEGVTEVPLPTRFVIFFLGTTGEEERYHELGRAISTVMADPVFKKIAYFSRSRDDLLAGLDEFLDQVVVLPPGEWDPTIRIPPPASPRKPGERLTTNAQAPMPSKEKKSAGGHGDTSGGPEEESLHHAGLKRSGRWFGGLVDDIKRRKPHFCPSDFKDALNIQSLASIIFIYFACIAPAITFGGLMGDKTGSYMSTMEMILASALCGCVYSLTAGQPLTILGATGPMLVFEEIVYSFSVENDIEYMSFRVWIGLWTALYCIILVATDASALVGLFTRFTEETFSILISFIFIYEAIMKIHKLGEKYPPLEGFKTNYTLEYNCSCMTGNETLGLMPSELTYSTCSEDFNGTAVGKGCPPLDKSGDVFFLSFIEFLGTFLIAIILKMFRTMPFLPTKARAIIADFAVIIAIICMVGMDVAYGVNTPKLLVPEKFQPTRHEDRGWFINPVPKGLVAWVPIAAALPALLAVILVFMDQQITALIVNRRENKLKKGPGYHLDLLIVGLLVAVCSLLGLPWVVAATVRSMTHVNSLNILDEKTAPGEKPKFLGVREQRVTNFMVFLLHGLSVLMTPILKLVPLPILYGLFLFMGVSSLKGVQFWERVQLLFIPPKHMPDSYYVRHVPNHRMHLFTICQLVSFAILCVVKQTAAKLVFPIAVLALVVVRYFLKYVFTPQELRILDDEMPELTKRKKEDGEDVEAAPYDEKNYLRPTAVGDQAVAERFRPLNITTAIDGSYPMQYAKRRMSGCSTGGLLPHVENSV